jgi:hypothetical protein
MNSSRGPDICNTSLSENKLTHMKNVTVYFLSPETAEMTRKIESEEELINDTISFSEPRLQHRSKSPIRSTFQWLRQSFAKTVAVVMSLKPLYKHLRVDRPAGNRHHRH